MNKISVGYGFIEFITNKNIPHTFFKDILTNIMNKMIPFQDYNNVLDWGKSRV